MYECYKKDPLGRKRNVLDWCLRDREIERERCKSHQKLTQRHIEKRETRGRERENEAERERDELM